MVWRDLDVCLLAGADCPPEERYHVPFDLDAGQGRWRIDLSVWLRDLHAHVADWHIRLRDTITREQRLAVLRIKDVWHRLPSYPDAVSGWEIYTAVLEDGVRTPERFARWLAANGDPDRSQREAGVRPAGGRAPATRGASARGLGGVQGHRPPARGLPETGSTRSTRRCRRVVLDRLLGPSP